MKPINYPKKEWRREWRERLAAGCVVRVKDVFGSQIELRSYPTVEQAHGYIAKLPIEFVGEIVVEPEFWNPVHNIVGCWVVTYLGLTLGWMGC